jgi:hypothetical protein|tara:strand:+ start:45782 stop:46489 length:708 start_codon:yes stop_codon:yes gene_type:complete
MELTKKQEYIKSMFPDSEDIESWVLDIVKKIHDLGEMFGTHKYDVWIAKEVKRDEVVILRSIELQLIIDWALESNTNIMQFDFDEALKQQEEWHEKMASITENTIIKIPNVNQDRIIYITNDKRFFLYVLDISDLMYEGTMMNHCVKGNNYKTKVKSKKSIILSLRDINNKPHVTLEIAISKDKKGEYSGRVIQQYGKANQIPKKKYREALKECVLFMCDCIDDETEKFLDMNYF